MVTVLCEKVLRKISRSKGWIKWTASNNVHTNSYNKKSRIKPAFVPSKMKAWHLNDFNGVENIQMGDLRVPTINSPQDVLIKVNAASLNPLDIRMSNGYGKEILGRMNQLIDTCDENGTFPLVLGRDFSGEVVDVGMDVSEYATGDEVFGALFPSSQGSLGEFVSASKYSVCYY